jgi:hypothetical protein
MPYCLYSFHVFVATPDRTELKVKMRRKGGGVFQQGSAEATRNRQNRSVNAALLIFR